MSMIRRRSATLVLLVLATGCGFGVGSGPEKDPNQPTAKSASVAGGPSIEIVSPEDLATVSGGTVPIVTKVRNFDLVDKIGKKAKKGQGHIIFYRLENEFAEVPATKKRSALIGDTPKGVFTAYPTAETTYAWPETPGQYTPEGTYRFAVQLVNNDHTPLSKPQVAQVTVEVEK